MRLKVLISVVLAVFCFSFSGAYAQDDTSKETETFFMAKKAFEDGFYEVSLGLAERILNNYPNSPKSPEVNLLIGECYLRQNKFLDALSKFETLLNKAESKGIKDAIYYDIAEVHLKGNNLDQAISFYKKLVNEFPNSSYTPLAYYSLGWCLFQQQKFKEAYDYFVILQTKYPKEIQAQDATIKIVECLHSLKDYVSLKDKINSALKLFSKDRLRLSYLYSYLGEAYYYLGNYQEAINAYSKAQLNNPDEKMLALSRLDMAWSYLKLKNYKEAEDLFLKIKQDNLDARSQNVFLLGKAVLMMETNRVSEAKELYTKLSEATNDPLILVESYIGKADALYNLADYRGAISAYRQALGKIVPDESNVDTLDKLHYNLSWALLKNENLPEAIKEFDWIVKESKDETLKVSALCEIGDIYQELGNYPQARKTYVVILNNYPESSYVDYAQYQIGMAALKVSDFKAATESLLKLTNNQKGSKYIDQAVYRIATAYFQKEDYKASQDMLVKFQTELKDSPLRQEALYLLGSCFYNQHDYKGAIQIFKDMLKSADMSEELSNKVEFEIADCLYRLGDEKEALSRFKVLRSKYPDSKITPEIIWWLGEYYYQHNEPALARRYFLSVIQDFPKSNLVAGAYYALGLISVEESRTQEALDNFSKVISLDKTELRVRAAIAMADIYAKTENSDEVIRLYKDVLKNYPDFSSQIYPKLAQAFLNSGDYSNALDYYGLSLTVAEVKELPGLHLKMAETYEAVFKLDAAIEEYLKALESSGQSKEFTLKVLLRLGQIYEDKGNLKEAEKYYKKITEMDVPESAYAQERISRLRSKLR